MRDRSARQLITSELHATEPSNAEEAAEFAAEESAASNSAFRPGHTISKLKKAKLAKRGTYRSFGTPAQPTRYAMGLTSTKDEAVPYLTYPVAAKDEAIYVAAMTDDYSALDGSPCLTGYAARHQGSCGSCYAFAATTAHALQACLTIHNAGGSADNFPMLTAQVSEDFVLAHQHAGPVPTLPTRAALLPLTHLRTTRYRRLPTCLPTYSLAC